MPLLEAEDTWQLGDTGNVKGMTGLGAGALMWDLDMGGRPNVETDIKCCEVSMNKVLRISSLKDHE